MEPNDTVLYLRVSTKAQDTKSQEPELRRWAKAHGVDWSTARIPDKFTGTSMDRPGFNRMMEGVRAGTVKTIVVWRLDRLGRTAKGLTALFDELVRLGVNLVSLKDGLDLSTPAGRLMANVLASVAAYETEVRAERILAGQAKAKADGKTWGGSVPGRRLKVTDEQVETVRAMVKSHRRPTAIARATGLSRPTVYSILREIAKTEPLPSWYTQAKGVKRLGVGED